MLILGIEHKEQEISSKERQIEKMKQEAQQALATKDRQIGKLREDASQLQWQLQELRLRPDGAGGDNAEVIKQVSWKKRCLAFDFLGNGNSLLLEF